MDSTTTSNGTKSPRGGGDTASEGGPADHASLLHVSTAPANGPPATRLVSRVNSRARVTIDPLVTSGSDGTAGGGGGSRSQHALPSFVTTLNLSGRRMSADATSADSSRGGDDDLTGTRPVSIASLGDNHTAPFHVPSSPNGNAIDVTMSRTDPSAAAAYRRHTSALSSSDGTDDLTSHHDNDNDHRGGGGGGGDTEDTRSSRLSNGTSLSSTTRKNRKIAQAAGVEVSKIPFSVQVGAAIAIPLLFTAVLSLLVIIPSQMSLDFVESKRTIVLSSHACTDALMVERGTMSKALGADVTNATLAQAIRDEDLPKLRKASDENCNAHLNIVIASTEPNIQKKYHNVLVDALKKWERVRTTFDVGNYSGRGLVTDERIAPITDIDSISLVVLADAQSSSRAVQWGNLYHVREMLNYIGALRASGSFLLNAKRVPTDGWRLATLWQPYQASVKFLTLLDAKADTPSAPLAAYATSTRVKTVVGIVADMLTGVAPANLTGAQYFDTVTLMMADVTRLVVEPIVAEATSAAQIRLSMIAPAVIVAVALIASVAAAVFVIRAQRIQTANLRSVLTLTRELSSSVARFVPRNFLRLMGAKAITDLAAGDCSEIAVTMLFSDIRAFSTISQQMTNVQLFDWLQQYLYHMTEIVKVHAGFIDKFVGDAIFAVFPECVPAVRCAVGMQVKVDELSIQMVARNEVEMLRVGVGLHHGVVCAGVFGDATRLTGTLVSTDVNLASRLEGLSKQFGARIIASEAVAERVPAEEFRMRRLGRCRTVGHAKPVVAHEIFQADALPVKLRKEETLDAFSAAVQQFEAAKVEEGRSLLEQLQSSDGDKLDPAVMTMLRKVEAATGDIVFDDK